MEIQYSWREGNKKGGEALTLLFLHGAAMSRESMERFFEAFPECNRLAPDLPGHGESGNVGRESIEAYADDVERLYGRLRGEGRLEGPVILAGYSMGGCIALELALRKLPGISGVIIMDSGADLGANAPLLEAVLSMKPEELDLEAVYSNCFGSGSAPAFKQEMMAEFVRTSADYTVCYHDFITAHDFNRLEACKGIEVPVLVISGDEDRIVPLMCAVHLKERIPCCNLAVMPFLGHSGIFEYTDFVVKTMRDFIALKILASSC